jgi:hypothetical protein
MSLAGAGWAMDDGDQLVQHCYDGFRLCAVDLGHGHDLRHLVAPGGVVPLDVLAFVVNLQVSSSTWSSTHLWNFHTR